MASNGLDGGRWRRAAIAVGLGAVLAGGLAACGPKAAAPAASEAAPPYDLNAGLNGLYAQSGGQSMVVAVVQGDTVTVRGFGQVHADDPRAPDATTLVRLESVSKLFASDLLAHLAAAGKLKLSDTLGAPAKALLLKRPWTPITLQELASHTSGLGRTAPIDPGLPADAAAAARKAWFDGDPPHDPPGVSAIYSNIAFDLLGDHLAAVAAAPYATALRNTVTGPLNMADTTAQPTPAQCARFMDYDAERPPKPCADQSGAAASGGLYSTAGDMGLWLKAQLAVGAASDPVRKISQAIYVPRAGLVKAIGLDHAGPAEGVGLAWIEEAPTAAHPLILEKTGGGDGYLTYVVIDPAHRVGLFFAIDHTGHHVLNPMSETANAMVGAMAAAAR